MTCELWGFTPNIVSGRILTLDNMTAHNTFEKPERIKPAEFMDAKIEG
jgi:alpha-N-arabinofuranosidase